MTNYILILTSVLLNACAQLFIKKGMFNIGVVSLDATHLSGLLLKGVTNIPIMLGMLSYAISIITWMVVLSRVNVSLAYPFLSIGYIFTAIMAYAFFNEPMTIQKIIGIIVICIGVLILSSSKG